MPISAALAGLGQQPIQDKDFLAFQLDHCATHDAILLTPKTLSVATSAGGWLKKSLPYCAERLNRLSPSSRRCELCTAIGVVDRRSRPGETSHCPVRAKSWSASNPESSRFASCGHEGPCTSWRSMPSPSRLRITERQAKPPWIGALFLRLVFGRAQLT
jgi:hypothetical protein